MGGRGRDAEEAQFRAFRYRLVVAEGGVHRDGIVAAHRRGELGGREVRGGRELGEVDLEGVVEGEAHAAGSRRGREKAFLALLLLLLLLFAKGTVGSVFYGA